MPRPPFPRLYAILDIDLLYARDLVPRDVVEAWLAAGVRLVQLRAKHLTFGPMLELADWMAARCSTVGASFIVNDRADVARLAGADGVHLGQEDLAVSEVRKILLPNQIVGLSAHSDVQIEAAIDQAADYLAMGPVFHTTTKVRPNPSVGLEGIARASSLARNAGRLLVAIGGITLESAPGVIAAGADAVAVINDLLVGDWRVRAAAYLRALG